MSNEHRLDRQAVATDLKTIYSDILIWMFIVVGIGGGISTGSTLYGLLVTGGLSSVYLMGGKHHV